MSFGFEYPAVLLLLLLVPLVAWAIVARRRSRPGLLYPSTERAAKAVRSSVGGTALFWTVTLRSIVLTLLVVALANPRFGSETQQVESSGVDIMLAVDMSGSMLALDMDWNGSRSTRLEVVKSVVDDFIAHRPSDRIGLIAFGTDPYLASPLTLEHDWLRENLKRIEVGLVPAGTSIGPPLAMAANRLRDAENSKSRIIILLTDGNDSQVPRVDPVEYAKAARAIGAKVYTIAVGTGGIVPSYMLNERGDDLLRYRNGKPVIQNNDFPLDETALKSIAEEGGGRFFRARDMTDLKDVYAEIDILEKTEIKLTVRTDYTDEWMLPLAAALGLLLVEQLLAATVLRTLP
jgi:Ca-activated chloride channel family protein